MPLTKTIRDILVPLEEYPHLSERATLRDAFEILHAGYAGGRRYRHLLVLNDKGQLLGVLGMRDILRGLLPDYLRTHELGHGRHEPQPDFPNLALIWAETCRTQCVVAAEKPVREFLGPIPSRLKLDDPVTKAAYLMVMEDTSMLPVVEGDRLVGVARMIEVFNVASEVVLNG